ncbi:mitochondrial antiviral-signaling protein [Scophthalmus maximus]|uniref:mitochondrial antiviral-signaling protein n=1 Tax=Scophthalmus maximus TaxID=52904 RepID=UPI001FA887F5|nr:mitochondrial antiviral-signaling protein [Scophthalmus maximus]
MSFASDKLYNGYLRRRMPAIVSKVKVKEIIVHLPCLTSHDRENIEAKRETYGNYDGMVLLLDCLKRRENWPEQFIEALEECEQTTIAAEIRAEYDALRGVNNSNPGSPSTTVIRAHVHPEPSAGHLSVPESGGAAAAAAAAPPAEASAPPEPAAPTTPPLETPVHPQAQQPSSPEAVPEPPQSAQTEVVPPPSTPPPSPEAPHTPASSAHREVKTHQEPEENSESDIQEVSDDNDVIPDQVDAVATPPLSRQGDKDTQPDPLPTTETTEVSPPQGLSPTQANSDDTDGSSFLTLTQEKPPVQDTAPPVDTIPAVVPEPEETAEPPTAQVVESDPQTDTAATASPSPNADGGGAFSFDDLCLSKPDQLISFQPQNHDSPTLPAHDLPAEPYSGDSQRLEMSDAAPDDVTSAHAPAPCSAVSSSSTFMTTVSALPCQENGVAFNHDEPEENEYESPCPSLEGQEVQVHVVRVSEEPSILNLEGQISASHAPVFNGEADGKIAPSPPSSTDKPPSQTADITAPALTTLPDSEEKKTTAPRATPSNTKYILTAVGVGACALLMAWKFKH